jgi:hypothetical protein
MAQCQRVFMALATVTMLHYTASRFFREGSMREGLGPMMASLALAAIWAAPAGAQHNPAMGEACAADMKTLCADVKPGMPTMQCMMKNRDKTSDGCKAAMRGNGAGGMSGPGQAQGGGKPNN